MLIRSEHNLLRFSLRSQAVETLIRKQKGKCKTQQYLLLLFLLLFCFVWFGFSLLTGKPNIDTVTQGTPEQKRSSGLGFVQRVLF